MDRGFCGERTRSFKNAGWRRKDSDYARVWRYDKCREGGIDNQKAWKNIWRDVECYWTQSEWSCKFQSGGRWGRSGRWWKLYRAGQAEWRWQTWLGGGHNPQNGTATHTEIAAEAAQIWKIDATGMGGHHQLLPWETYEIWYCQIGCSGSYQAANW